MYLCYVILISIGFLFYILTLLWKIKCFHYQLIYSVRYQSKCVKYKKYKFEYEKDNLIVTRLNHRAPFFG